MSNQYNYNLTGAERKAFVGVISEILGEPAIYKKAPSFSYQIGCYNVDKNGMLSCSEETDSGKLNELVEELGRRGYAAETERRANGLDVTLPLADFDGEAYLRLSKIIASKEGLLKKALGTDQLPIIIKDDQIRFPWFTLHDIDGEADAYARLVTALVRMAKTQKRVTAKAKELTNEKFTMRLFLIRLGFIGDEYKTARKILLSNLSGNSSWKAGQPPERTPEAAVEGVIEPVALGSSEAPETKYESKEGGALYDKE